MKSPTLLACLVGIFVISACQASSDDPEWGRHKTLKIESIDHGYMDLYFMRGQGRGCFKSSCEYISQRAKCPGSFCSQTKEMCKSFLPTVKRFNEGDALLVTCGNFSSEPGIDFLRLTKYMKKGTLSLEIKGLVGVEDGKLARMQSIWRVKPNRLNEQIISGCDVEIVEDSIKAFYDDEPWKCHHNLTNKVMGFKTNQYLHDYYAKLFNILKKKMCIA